MSEPDPDDDTGISTDEPTADDRTAADADSRSSQTRTDTAHEPHAETGANERSPTESTATTSEQEAVTIEDDGLVRWFLKTDDGNVILLRDILSSVAIVAVIGLLLFAASGVWPPLVAVESGSMEPNMERGDLIFVVDEDRYAGDGAIPGTGIVTADSSEGHEKFGDDGDVIIFQPDGDETRTPIIHRAKYHVEEGDDWVEAHADPALVNGANCTELQHCEAAHDGFITHGDANTNYDQAGDQSDVVKEEWVTGKAMYRIPYLGHIRLAFDGFFGSIAVTDTEPHAVGDSNLLPAGVVGIAGGISVTRAYRNGDN